MTLEEISNRYTIPQNVEALKAILANPRAWEAVDEMFIKTVNELAGRDTLTSDGGKLYLRHGHDMTVKGSGNTRTLVISGAEMASVATNNCNYTTAEKGLLWIGMAFIVNNGIYKEPQWKSDVRNINYQALRVLGITKFNRRVMVILSEIIGKTLKFEIVNPMGRKIVIVKEVPISDVADIETFITDPSNDYYEVKRAKEDYYLDYLMSCKTGQYILTTKAKFADKVMSASKFRGLHNGDVITEFSTRFKLYIKKSAVEVHELHTRTMAIHDYNVTFE